jgi:TatA/E family protein of Tat protein translocase
MFDLGAKEILIIAAVMVLLFGSKRIPVLAKDLVEAVKNLTGLFSGSTDVDESKKK